MSSQSRRSPRKKGGSSILPIALSVIGLIVLVLAIVSSRNGKPSAGGTPEVTGAPKLKADRELVDLGDVKLDNVVSVEFQLTNTGDQTLRFTDDPFIEVVEGC